MTSFSKQIEVLFPGIDKADYELSRKTGDVNPTITKWSHTEPEPTEAEILAVTDEQVKDMLDDREADIDKLDPFMKAFAIVFIEELNALRAQHGAAPRDKAWLKAAIKAKL
jgi:hypothetical protein